MNQNLKIFAVALAAFLIGSLVNNVAAIAASSLPSFKVAVVDVHTVVENSDQVKKLKESRTLKVQDLSAFVKDAKASLEKEKNANKKKALEDKYNKELNDRKQKMDEEYAASLSDIDKNISAIISQTAKSNNYNLVFAKGVVLFGGDDITDAVSKAVK